MKQARVQFVRQFLEVSSIHGLRYLSEVKSVLSKSLWLCCICISFGAASVIIYMNVVNWSNAPTVVTRVEPALAKGLNFMPTVMVCPHYPNYNNLLYHLISMYPAEVENLGYMKQVTDFLREDLVRTRIEGTEWQHLDWKYRTVNASPMFDSCLHYLNNTEKCNFVELLSGIVKGLYETDKTFEAVRAYIMDRTVRQDIPDLESLKAFVEGYHELTINSTEYPGLDLRQQEKVRDLYSLFFPVLDIVNGTAKIGLLKPISSYVPMELKGDSLIVEDFASLVAYMIDYKLMQAKRNSDDKSYLNRLTTKILFSLASKLLRASDEDDLLRTVTSYSYDSTNYPPLEYWKDASENSPIFEPECQEEMDLFQGTITELCNQDGDFNPLISSKCRQYCIKYVLDHSLHEVSHQFYKLAADSVGPLRPGMPQSLLPACQNPGDDKDVVEHQGCWEKIVTSEGICFFSTAYDPFIKGIGQSYAFKFAMDIGGQFKINNLPGGMSLSSHQPYVDYIPSAYSIKLLPPNHFDFGRFHDNNVGDFRRFHDSNVRTITYVRRSLRGIGEIKVQLDLVGGGSEDFRALSPEKRNCLYADEVGLDYFPAYSEPNCILECAWKTARDSCNCVPWFLMDHFPGSLMCEFHGNRCFKNIVDGRFDVEVDSNICMKQCLPDCETVQYTTSLGFLPDDVTVQDRKTSENSLYYDYVTVHKINNTKMDIQDLLQPFRKQSFQDDNVGVVQVYIDKKSTLRIVMTATVTIIDMISNIGGTLGLFCGFSLLSGVEALYWITLFLRGKK